MAGDEAAMEEIKYPFRFNFMHLLSVECWTRRNIPERPWTLEGGRKEGEQLRRTHKALQTEWQFPVMVLLSRDNLPINWIGKGRGGGEGNQNEEFASEEENPLCRSKWPPSPRVTLPPWLLHVLRPEGEADGGAEHSVI